MANTFNPEANLPNAQDFTNASKGFTDNGLGTFVGGIAEDLDTGLKAIDRGVAAKANDDVRSAVEDTDAQLLGIKNQGPAEDPLRREIKDQVQNLADKKLAMDAGTIDPQHYYATIQAKVKDIRARYSGYNDQIDDDLKQLGIDPNWQRREIIEEGLKAQAAARGSAAEAAKNAREFTEAAINNKSAVIPPEFRAKMADPNFSTDPNNMKQLKLYLLQSNDLYSRMEIQKAKAEFDAANGKGQSKDLGVAYGNSLNTIFYIASKNGGAYDLVKKAQEKLNQDARMGGGAVPTEDIDNLRNAYRSFRSQMEAGRLQVKSSFSDSASLFTDEMKKQDEAFTGILDNIDKAISNKDWGGLSTNLAHVEATIAGARSRQLDNSEFIQSQAATRANIGDQSASMVFSRNLEQSVSAVSADGKNALARDQINGKSKSLVDDMKRFRTDVPDARPEDFRNIFDNSIDLILHPEGKPAGRLNVFETMFGQDNQGFWDNLQNNAKLSDSDRRAYFRTLTSPQMQKAVGELSQYDPRASTKLYQYTQYMFQKMNQDTATNVNDTVINSSNATVVYDPATKHLKVVPTNNADASTLGAIWDKTRGAQNAVDNWNDGIDALIPQWEKQGIDVNTAAQTLMERAGINLNAPKQGNLIDRGIDAVSSWFNRPIPDGAADVGKAIQQGVTPSKLGGPGSTGGDSLPALGGPGFAHAVNTRNQPNAFQASGQELKELYDAAAKAKDDPELRAIIMQHIKSITKDLPNTDGAPKLQSSFQPRGNPAPGTPTDAQAAVGKNVIDTITGIPSFIDAVKSGDPKEIAKQAAMAMATIIPFPGGKAVKILNEAGTSALKFGNEVVTGINHSDALERAAMLFKETDLDKLASKVTEEGHIVDGRFLDRSQTERALNTGSNNVTDATTLEARRAAKGMDASSNVANEIEKTITNRSAIYDALGLKNGADDFSKMSPQALDQIESTLNVALRSKNIKPDEKKAVQTILEDLSARKTSSTDWRNEALSQRVSDFRAERAQKLVDRYTPKEIGQKIDQIKEFIKHGSPENIPLHKDELDLWQRAQQLLRKNIKPVKD